MSEKWRPLNCLLLVLEKCNQHDQAIFFNKTIIPLALVGYEMIIANSALRASLAIYHSYPTHARRIFVNYRCLHAGYLF